MNQLLKTITEEIENEAMTNKTLGRKQIEGMCVAINIINKHMDELEKNNTNEDVLSYISRRFLEVV